LLTAQTIDDRATWNDTLRALPYAHVLQSWEWGEFKRVTTGWIPHRVAFRRGSEIVAMASIGVRRVGPLAVLYAPKGPALAYDDTGLLMDVLDYLEKFARQTRLGAIWLKIDPDVIAATGVPSGTGDDADTANPTGRAVMAALRERGWRFSADQVQFRNTMALDLTRPEDELLAAMSQSTRRKIRIALREGVTVRQGSADDLPLLYDLYRVTGARDGFLIRPPEYYQHEWRYLMEAGLAQPLIAEFEGAALGHVILFHFGRTCWYFYGASSDEQRDKMPNTLLQWEALRWAKARGYSVYDFWGAPDVFDESDRMWGVYNFKRGFHGTVRRHIGAWDYAPSRPLYYAYTELMPRVMGWLRRRRER
jgi:lipid II:glycine glycyltransferase (peptidoglycan interpeptide bridge formation enzyme)